MHDQTDKAIGQTSSRPAGIPPRPVVSVSTPITPPDPQRGICPTCGLWAKLPEPNEDTMHAAQVRALGAGAQLAPKGVDKPANAGVEGGDLLALRRAGA